MKTVTFTLSDLLELHRLAATERLETCAVGFVHRAGEGQDGPRYTVREVMHAPETAYLDRTPSRASLSPEFMVTVANRARALKAGVVMLHTHPGMHPLQGFSSEDDHGEAAVRVYFAARLPGQDHFTAVVTHSALHMRDMGGMGGTTQAAATAVGASVRRYMGTDDCSPRRHFGRPLPTIDPDVSLRPSADGGDGQLPGSSSRRRGIGRNDKPITGTGYHRGTHGWAALGAIGLGHQRDIGAQHAQVTVLGRPIQGSALR